MASKNHKKSSKKAESNQAETPAESFCRLAQGRTNKAVKAISLIAQLTGTAYVSTDVQRRAVVAALQSAIDQVQDTFEGKTKASDSFRLPS